MKLGGFAQSVSKGMLLIGLFSGLHVGCVAQQADVARIQKDLEQQIGQLKSEKLALEQQVDEARSAISESQNLIAAQKADMTKMRSDLAPLNQQIKLLREQDLTSLYGNYEQAEKKISDLRQDLTSQTEKLGRDIQALQATTATQGEQQQLTQTQADALAQQIDEKNQSLTDKMGEFQVAFGQFKETLGTLSTDISQVQTNIETLQTDTATQGQSLTTVKNQTANLEQSITQVKQTLDQSGTALGTNIEEQAGQLTALQQQVNALQEKLTTDTQALRTFLEQDVKTAMDQAVGDMEARQLPIDQKIAALQSDVEALGIHVQADATQVQELTQTVVKLREAQDVMGSLLGKRGDEILQQAGRLSERMATVESHQSTLTEQLQTNTNQTSVHLKEVNASLTSISQSLEQTTQSMSERLTQQEQTVATLNQTMQKFQQLKRETEGQIQQMKNATQVSEHLRQNIEQMAKRMRDLEIHQSELVGKLDSDAQITTTHLQEVNQGIKSVAQALENATSKLNTRITNQEEQLNRAITKFQSVENSAEVSQANIQHLNDLTGTMNQLQDVITTIGTKLGERVDAHESRLSQLAQRVNQLQSSKSKK